MKTLVCLVSRQAMANVIPVYFLSPEKVILIATEKEKETAESIKELLDKKKINCQIHKDFINPYKIDSVTNVCEQIIKRNLNKELILNFTGGTKIMSFGAFEAFRKYKLDRIYCDTEEDTIIWFKISGISEEKFSIKINIDEYLLSYGYRIKEDEKDKGIFNLDFLEFIKTHLEEFIKFSLKLREFEKTNKLRDYKNYSRNIENFTISIGYKPEIIIDYKNEEILKLPVKNENYLTGLWFEDFIYDFLKNTFKPDDIKKNYKWISKTGTCNEVDVLLTKNGRLYLFSCKTFLETKSIPKEILFELETLRNLAGGTFGKAILMTLFKNEQLVKRTKELGIKLVSVDDLKTFVL